MSPALVAVGFFSDFIISAGGALSVATVATGAQWPAKWVIVSALIVGAVNGAINVKAMLFNPTPPPQGTLPGLGLSGVGRKIMVALVTGSLLALAACATPFGLSGSAAQLHELVKDKNASCSSATGLYMGATVRVSAVNVDKATVPPGSTVKIKGDTCDTEITTGESPRDALSGAPVLSK